MFTDHSSRWTMLTGGAGSLIGRRPLELRVKARKGPWTVCPLHRRSGGTAEWTEEEKLEESSGRIGKIYKEIGKKKKAKFLVERIFLYKEWVKKVKEAGEHLKKSAIVWWRIGIDEIVKWSERKEDHLFENYVREATKASHELHMNIGSLDSAMNRQRRLQIGGGSSDAISFSFWASWQSVFGDWSQTYPAVYCLHCGVCFSSHLFPFLGTVLAKLNAVPTLYSLTKDDGTRVLWMWGEMVVCFCMPCLWGTNFALNCFPLLGSSFCEGFCVFECSECISPCCATR